MIHFIVWYLVGFISSIIFMKSQYTYVTLRNFLICYISALLGPILPILIFGAFVYDFLENIDWDKKLF